MEKEKEREEPDVKRAVWGIVLATTVLFMSGCTAKDIETQAYAVSLGVDLMDEERISVSVQVPALTQSGGAETGEEGGGEAGDKGYSFAEANGNSLTEALEMLHATLPRALNLTGVKSIVISEKLARSQQFIDVLHEMALSYRFFGAAELVVCREEAGKFIESQQAVIGHRLSESTAVALEHYHEIGCIPSSKAADVYYMSRSIYGDSVSALAAINEDQERGGDQYAGELSRSGDDKNLYFGSALFRQGIMVGMLTGTQTQMLNVILGDLKNFSWVVENVPVRISVSKGPDVLVNLNDEKIEINVRITFDIMDAEQKADMEIIRERLRMQMNELTDYCQKLGTDPFCYAERAAMKFRTIDDWLQYDWRTKFQGAEVRYEVYVRRSEY